MSSTPDTTQASADPYVLTLPGGIIEALARGANLALVGPGAIESADAFAEGHRAAVLLDDGAGPLHSGLAVGEQIAAALVGTRRAARDRAVDLLELTGVSEPHLRVAARPDRLSPLDRQRAQLALVLANAPELIVARDPCAGLGPHAAATFGSILHRLWSRRGFTLLLAVTDPADAQRAAEQMLLLGVEGEITERRRRRA